MAWLDENGTSEQARMDRRIRRACAHLREHDPVVGHLIDLHGPYRLRATHNYFQLMVETIISQQLSTKAAQSIYNRLKANLGGGAPTPRRILGADDADLLSAGLSRSKVQYVRNVAQAFRSSRLGPATFTRLDDEAVAARLTAIKGVGEWSAHMFLIFALGRIDVFPVGDLGLRNAMTRQYRMRRTGSLRRFHRIAERWRPYRTVGSLYLWKSYDDL